MNILYSTEFERKDGRVHEFVSLELNGISDDDCDSLSIMVSFSGIWLHNIQPEVTQTVLLIRPLHLQPSIRTVFIP